MFGLVNYQNLRADRAQPNVSQTFLAWRSLLLLHCLHRKRSAQFLSIAHAVVGEYICSLVIIDTNTSFSSLCVTEDVFGVCLTELMMTKPQRLSLFLKKMLSMSRHDMGTASSKQLSFSSSRESSQRSWSSSCRSLASSANFDSEDECCSSTPPNDIPDGCLPVYVGRERRRFVIPTAYLSNSTFRALLAKSEDEYGFKGDGGLRIACSPDVFEHFLWWLQGGTQT